MPLEWRRFFKILSRELEKQTELRCFCAFVETLGDLDGFTFPDASDYLVASSLPGAVSDLLSSPCASVRVRLLFQIEPVYLSHYAPNFFEAAERVVGEHLFITPHFAPDELLAAEPFVIAKWRGEVVLTLHPDSLKIVSHIFTTDLTVKETSQMRQAVDNALAIYANPSHEARMNGVVKSDKKTDGLIDSQMIFSQVERVKERMKQGECYLLNLSTQVRGLVSAGDFALEGFLDRWCKANSRFGIFFNYAGLGMMSFSPERFVAGSGQFVVTEPIKGTVKVKSSVATEDDARGLWSSQKEMCEQSLVVDLLRNDFNGFCRPGSVRVFKPFFVRKTESLLQMQSFVFGEVEHETSYGRFLKAVLPAGSVTGTPKARVCELIETFEGVPRGYYTGVFGIGQFKSKFESVVLIRSHFMGRLGIYTGVGAGITTLSDASMEARELSAKLESFL